MFVIGHRLAFWPTGTQIVCLSDVKLEQRSSPTRQSPVSGSIKLRSSYAFVPRPRQKVTPSTAVISIPGLAPTVIVFF